MKLYSTSTITQNIDANGQTHRKAAQIHFEARVILWFKWKDNSCVLYLLIVQGFLNNSLKNMIHDHGLRNENKESS